MTRGQSQADISLEAPLRDSNGAIYGVCGISTDITERKQIEEFRQEYVSLISHDLRQPLTTIMGMSGLLRKQLVEEGNAQRARVVGMIEASGKNMNTMIQEMVDLTRLETRQMKLDKEIVDLFGLVSEITERVGTVEDRQRISIESVEWIPPVAVDGNNFERALINLITNALKYSTTETPVKVRLVGAGDEAIISVIDQGIGISPEEISHVFDRFYRAKSGKKKADGLGLGLYISRLIVEAHGGRIWAESEIGRGTTFHFTLPLA